MASSATLFQFPHFLKPVQAIVAVVITICIGTASAVAGNGVIWFTVILALVVSVVATVVFVLGVEDQISSMFSNETISWDFFEMVYSFAIAILSAASVWLSFSFISQVPDAGNYKGYIAGGIFLIILCGLFAVPTLFFCRKTQQVTRNEIDPIVIRDATTPYSESSYQSPI